METTERSRDAQASCDGSALQALGDLLIGPLLDQAQDEQFPLCVREAGDGSKDGRGKRQAVVHGLKVGVHDGDRETQTLPSSVLDPSLAQG
jgi:hypothetical protein